MHPTQAMQRFNLPAGVIIHVGANTGQERFVYRDAAARFVLYIEPIEEVFRELQQNIEGFEGHYAANAVCSDRSGDIVRFNVASNGGQSSSMFGLGAHATLYPDIIYCRTEEMVTTTLDSIVETQFPADRFHRKIQDERFALLVIDVQGAEIKVLQGASKVLGWIDALYVEVSEAPVYEGGCTVHEITALLGSRGFRMKWMEMNVVGWGNAFYVHDRVFDRTPLPVAGPNIALNKPASQSSTSAWSKPDDAQGAVTGIVTGQFGFHTELEDNPWWQVDLLDRHPIREIRIYNRGDGWQERASALVVSLSDDGIAWRAVHDQNGKTFGFYGARTWVLRVFPEGEHARFVRVQLNDRQYLHLDEVEIYS